MTNEPQSSQANDMPPASSGDTAIADAPMTPDERFSRGEDVQRLYEQMRPDQRTAIAGEFIRLLTLAGDDQADQFRDRFQQHTQLPHLADEKSEELLSADQVAAVDSYVRQSHPAMIAQMLDHPVTQSALAIPGVETDEAQAGTPPLEDKIMPTENVATSGAAYATSWQMMELGGEEANRLSEDPHEQAVSPALDAEREQRAVENAGEEGERPSQEPPEHNS